MREPFCDVQLVILATLQRVAELARQRQSAEEFLILLACVQMTQRMFRYGFDHQDQGSNEYRQIANWHYLISAVSKSRARPMIAQDSAAVSRTMAAVKAYSFLENVQAPMTSNAASRI